MDDKKICPHCGTGNEEEYVFCKNCGAKLDTQNGAYTPPFTSQQQGNPIFSNFGNSPETIDGVSTEKIAAFIGPEKKNYYIPRFIAMDKTGKRTAWHWPVAILGLLLAPPFLAAWFFYRKMPKIGMLICALMLIITSLFTAITYSDTKATAEEIYKNSTDIAALEQYIEAEETENPTAKSMIIEYAQLIISAAVIAFFSSNANYFYMKHTTKTIRNLDLDGSAKNPEFYYLSGRPSAVLAVVVPLIFSLINSAITMAPVFSALISSGILNNFN